MWHGSESGPSQLLIWLSGPTGAGKTSLARSLRLSGYSIVEEDVPDGLFRAFAAKPIDNCEPLQRHFMKSRFDEWSKVSRASRIAFDRTIDEDVEVFCKLHKRTGSLTQTQYDSLAQFGKNLQDQIPKPDLIVFVTASPAVLFHRLQSTDSPSEIVESLDLQMSLYSEWLLTRNEQVLHLDTSRLSEIAMTKFWREIRTC